MKSIYDISFFRASSDKINNTIKYEIGSTVTFDESNRLKAYSDVVSGIYNYNLNHDEEDAVSLIACTSHRFRVSVNIPASVRMCYDVALDLMQEILKDARYIKLKVTNGDDNDAKRA